MQDLIKQEQFEIEVLDRLNTKRFLQNLVFCGGTMLRLCWELDRYSVDLDFWIIKNMDFGKFLNELKTELSEYYKVKDSANKFQTIVFELKSPVYPRSLKVEIRKEQKKIKIENSIAFSTFSNTQVMVKAVSLEDMMNAKIQAFLSRKEIRDIYDIEFMFKRGIQVETGKENINLLLRGIEAFTKKDYSVKLGSLLEANQRKYYTENNFIILRRHLLSLL
jgi:predicted nucleotidyltransferase component of viral defense system